MGRNEALRFPASTQVEEGVQMPWQMGAICEIMQNLTMKLLGLADGSFVGKIGTSLPFGCGIAVRCLRKSC